MTQTTCSAVVDTPKRFSIRSTVQQIAMMDAIAHINHEDRHELIRRLLKKEVLNTLQCDLTNISPQPFITERVEEIFN